jgi:Tol biopolymer transport system component
MLEKWAHAGHPRLSGDGRRLVFEADVITELPSRLRVEIVLRDRSTGTSIRVGPRHTGEAANGSSSVPDISDDGRVVAFSSTATNLVPVADANGSAEDVYTLEIATQTIRRVSVDSSGRQLFQGLSFSPSLSADGRVIAFASTAPLSPAAARREAARLRTNLRQVYVRDEARHTTTQISLLDRDRWPDGESMTPAISGDGRYVAFVSLATNLVQGDRNRLADVFLHDRETRSTRLISRALDGGSANGRSLTPSMSFDGRFVAFQSDASNLVCARRCSDEGEDINLLWDVFVADWRGGVVLRVSDDHLGSWMEPSVGPALDAEGLLVAFASRHPMDGSDRTNDFDLFVRSVRQIHATAVGLLVPGR